MLSLHVYLYTHGLQHGEIWNPNKKIRIHIILPFVGKHVKAVILYWQNSSEQHVLNISSILQPKKCTCTSLCKRDAMLSTTYLISKFYTISKKKIQFEFPCNCIIILIWRVACENLMIYASEYQEIMVR